MSLLLTARPVTAVIPSDGPMNILTSSSCSVMSYTATVLTTPTAAVSYTATVLTTPTAAVSCLTQPQC